MWDGGRGWGWGLMIIIPPEIKTEHFGGQEMSALEPPGGVSLESRCRLYQREAGFYVQIMNYKIYTSGTHQSVSL